MKQFPEKKIFQIQTKERQREREKWARQRERERCLQQTADWDKQKLLINNWHEYWRLRENIVIINIVFICLFYPDAKTPNTSMKNVHLPFPLRYTCFTAHSRQTKNEAKTPTTEEHLFRFYYVVIVVVWRYESVQLLLVQQTNPVKRIWIPSIP